MRAVAFWVLLVVCAVLQSSVSFRLRLWGGQPDFLLVLALSAALLSNATQGALCGFAVGLVTGALHGETVGTWIVTRVLVGYLAGRTVERVVQPGVLVAVAGTLVGSVLAGLLYGLSVPGIGLNRWIALTLPTAGLNLVAAVPIALLLHRAGWGSEDTGRQAI